MGIEVRHSPNVKLAGNVAAQAGAGRARREDEQQARAAAERRAAQEAQIQAQYERDLMQAEIQAQRDQDQFERTKEMDAVNFQQQNEMFQKQGVQRANEAEAAFDRQLETIDYGLEAKRLDEESRRPKSYTAWERGQNEKIDHKIQELMIDPRFSDSEKEHLVRQLESKRLKPTGKPTDFSDEVKNNRWIETLPNGEQILYVKGANGLEYRPLKQPEQKTDSGKLRFDVQKARAAHVARLLAIRDTDNNPRYTEEQATADAEKRFPMSGGSASKVTPTREQQEARALAESFGVQFQGETPADLSVVAEDLKKTDVRAMTKKHGFKLDDLSVVPADANTTQSQRESQNEANSAARAPVGLKAEDLQAEYSKALRKSFATAKQAGVSPAEAEQVSEEHKAELMGLIRQSLLAEAQKYGQIGNAPPQEKARLMKLRSLLELWKGTVGNAAPTRGIKPPAPPQGEFE